MAISKVDVKELLMQAMACDQAGYVMEAQCLYEEGIALLAIKLESEERQLKKIVLRKRMHECEARSRQLSLQMQDHLHNAKLIEHVSVADGSRGHSYQTVFGRYMNSMVKEVHIYEPHMTTNFHFKNLVSLMELIIKRCRNLQYIRLVTRMATKHQKNQHNILERIQTDAAEGNIIFKFIYVENLSDKKIVLGNGYVFKVERGLHFFQSNDSWFTLGLCDYDFRKCLETDIEIWQAKPFAEKILT